MSESMPVTRDASKQMPIPTVWRDILSAIVTAFKSGDFQLTREINGVRPIPEEVARSIANNIESYGARLTTLPEDSWLTSVCQWMEGYWDVLVDLFTIEEGASDLVLAVRVFDLNNSYSFEVSSVYVP